MAYTRPGYCIVNSANPVLAVADAPTQLDLSGIVEATGGIAAVQGDATKLLLPGPATYYVNGAGFAWDTASPANSLVCRPRGEGVLPPNDNLGLDVYSSRLLPGDEDASAVGFGAFTVPEGGGYLHLDALQHGPGDFNVGGNLLVIRIS